MKKILQQSHWLYVLFLSKNRDCLRLFHLFNLEDKYTNIRWLFDPLEREELKYQNDISRTDINHG